MNRKGQVAVYLVMVLVALTILTVMNVDLFVSVRDKFRVQNAGDAAALAAARHQGHLLNEIGRLNLEHIYAAIKDNSARIAEIEFSQRRLALLGPIEAVRLSSEAALKNGAEIRNEFSDFLLDHARFVREVYASGDGSETDPYPASWPGAWEEYASEIERVAREGLAAGVDNVDFHNAAGSHILMCRNFYNAIRGRDWCWFYLTYGMNDVLEGYNSFHDWAPIQKKNSYAFANSEIYSLYIEFRQCPLVSLFSVKEITEMMNNADYKVTEKEVRSSSAIRDPKATWAIFDNLMWRNWSDAEGFPFVASVKQEFCYHGAAALCRVFYDNNVWTGAAKPLAPLDTTRQDNLVSDGFDAVRLVPVDTIGGSDLATADIPWIRHVREHLEPYLESGTGAIKASCDYCFDLKQWEKSSFRQSGIFWLKFNSHSCKRPTGVPGFGCMGTGGAAHGH